MEKTIMKQKKVKHKEIDYDFVRQIEKSLEDLRKGRFKKIAQKALQPII